MRYGKLSRLRRGKGRVDKMERERDRERERERERGGGGAWLYHRDITEDWRPLEIQSLSECVIK